MFSGICFNWTTTTIILKGYGFFKMAMLNYSHNIYPAQRRPFSRSRELIPRYETVAGLVASPKYGGRGYGSNSPTMGWYTLFEPGDIRGEYHLSKPFGWLIPTREMSTLAIPSSFLETLPKANTHKTTYSCDHSLQNGIKNMIPQTQQWKPPS